MPWMYVYDGVSILIQGETLLLSNVYKRPPDQTELIHFKLRARFAGGVQNEYSRPLYTTVISTAPRSTHGQTHYHYGGPAVHTIHVSRGSLRGCTPGE